MHKLQIATNNSASRIFIANDTLERVGELAGIQNYSSVFVVSEETAAGFFLDRLLKGLPKSTAHFTVRSGEEFKHIDTVQDIWKAMHAAGCDRKTLVINLGGGVLCDIAGFAASTYMRGVDFVHVPTTLLSQVDACIGGKTGINFDGVKNLVGSFRQPVSVVIDPALLKTLPSREFIAGFGEIIKHGLISDPDYLKLVTSKTPLDFTVKELELIIAGSCRIKTEIVNQDSTEKGLRKAVNFGHTVGHAVEALSLKTERPLLHGEAVAIGMVVEAELSRRPGMLAGQDVDLVKQVIAKAGLPSSVPPFSVDKVMEVMRSDKKNHAGSIRFTLLEAIGKAVYDQTVEARVVRKAIEESRQS